VRADSAIIPAAHARWIVAFCSDAIKRWERAGSVIPPEVRVTLDALVAIAGQHEAEPVPEPAWRELIPTSEAAGSLHVSERRVRAMHAENVVGGSLIAGKLYLDAEDVWSLVEHRARLHAAQRNPRE